MCVGSVNRNDSNHPNDCRKIIVPYRVQLNNTSQGFQDETNYVGRRNPDGRHADVFNGGLSCRASHPTLPQCQVRTEGGNQRQGGFCH